MGSKYMIVSVPTDRTRRRLTEIFMSSPVSIDFNELYIPLYIGDVEDSNGTYPPAASVRKGPYEGKFTNFRSEYHDLHDAPALVGELESLGLRERATQLGSPPDFHIHLVFLNHAPPVSRTNKSFLVSISDTLVSKEWEPFTFEKDLLIEL